MVRRVNGRLPWLVLIFTALLASPRESRAQGTETDVAAEFFEAGSAAAKRGEYRVCAEAFTEAHKRAPHGATIYNAGLCWENAKDLPRAANDYKEALLLDNLSGAQESQAKKRFAELKKKLAEVEVASPEGAFTTLGPITQGKIPFTTFLNPGPYEVRIEGSDGEVVSKQIEVDAGDREVVKLAFSKDAPDRPARPATTGTTRSTEVDESTNHQATIGWVAIGVSVVAGGIAGGYYLSALSAKDDYDKLEDNDQNRAARDELRDKAYSRVKVARVLGIGAGVAAIAGVTLVLTAPKKKPSAAIRVYPGGASALFSF